MAPGLTPGAISAIAESAESDDTYLLLHIHIYKMVNFLLPARRWPIDSPI